MSANVSPAGGSANRPDFVVIGAMKCGTSTLHDQLGANPGLFMSDPKEPNFFSDDDVFARGFDWYEALFTGAADDQLCGESSTHYTKSPTLPHAAERLAERLPDARLIYVVRDPVQRLVSHYIHEWTEKTVRGSIDDAVAGTNRFIDYSRYAYQLEPYLERFGADRVKLVFFERMTRDPQRELERIGAFLGRPGLVWDASRGARNVSRERLRRSPVRDRIVASPLLTRLRRQLVPKSVRERIRGLWQMEARPELSAAARAHVTGVLDRDLARLGGWLGANALSCASYGDFVEDCRGDWTEEVRARFPSER